MDERELLDKWKAERERLNVLIDALEARISGGTSVPFHDGTSPRSEHSIPPKASLPKGRPDEFFGMSQTDAAAAYLKKVGHAVHIDDILAALQGGGLKLAGKNPKAILYTSLIRGTKRFVLISPGTFGLSEFYPNRKAGESKDDE